MTRLHIATAAILGALAGAHLATIALAIATRRRRIPDLRPEDVPTVRPSHPAGAEPDFPALRRAAFEEFEKTPEVWTARNTYALTREIWGRG